MSEDRERKFAKVLSTRGSANRTLPRMAVEPCWLDWDAYYEREEAECRRERVTPYDGRILEDLHGRD